MKNLVGIFIAVAVVVGLKFYNKNDDSQTVRNEMSQVVQQLPEYQNDSEYIDSIFDTAHEFAFEQSYKMGGRRQASELDSKRYLAYLFAGMSRKAKKDGHLMLHSKLETRRKAMGLPNVQFN